MQATETLREKLTRINGELRQAGRPDNFYLSLEQSWNRYGSLTERQEQALLRSFERLDERQARRAQENATVTEPMPTGRVVISGEIVSTKWQENRFGGAWKMLVKSDAGWKVYGTIPASIAYAEEESRIAEMDELRGYRVTFTASIEPKEPSFGFFSRPTNASVQAKPGQQPEATAPVAPAPAVPPTAAGRLVAKEVKPTPPGGRLADIIARAKELEERRFREREAQADRWDTDSMN